jgi:hypothetical protein
MRKGGCGVERGLSGLGAAVPGSGWSGTCLSWCCARLELAQVP